MRISTEAIWGLRAMKKCSIEHYAEWAAGALEEGFDSRNLRILAGIELKSSLFEAEDYFQRTANELRLIEPPKETAMKAYSSCVAEQILERKMPAREGVKMLFRVCIECGYPKYLMMWYSLDEACDDVDYGNYPFSYPGLTKENLEDTVFKEAKEFIDRHKKQAN
jgi:hypothetical protein